jgi:hypothetical protein
LPHSSQAVKQGRLANIWIAKQDKIHRFLLHAGITEILAASSGRMDIRIEPFPTIRGPEKEILPSTSHTVPGIMPTSASLLHNAGCEHETNETFFSV